MPVLTCMLLLLNLLLLRLLLLLCLLLLLYFVLKYCCNQICDPQPITHDPGGSPHTNVVACMCCACRFPCLANGHLLEELACILISQQELRGYPTSLAVSYAVYKPYFCYLGEAHLDPLQKEQLPTPK